jgi:flagellar biosynthesis protein FlhG
MREEERHPMAAARSTRVIAVSSGKGGVGKTSFAANVAISLQRRRKKVLVIDADLGLANIDIILGLRPEAHLGDVIHGGKTLEDILMRGPGGIHILPASSGLEEMAALSEGDRMLLTERLGALDGRYDIVLIDTSAGISSNVIYFNLAAQASIVVVTPEPTSRTDAYAFIKVLFLNHARKRFEVLVNQAATETEGRAVYQNLLEVADRHLGDVSLGYLGCLRRDPKVAEAVRRQQAVIEAFPDSCFAAEIRSVGAKLASLPGTGLEGGLGLFWRHLAAPSLAEGG